MLFSDGIEVRCNRERRQRRRRLAVSQATPRSTATSIESQSPTRSRRPRPATIVVVDTKLLLQPPSLPLPQRRQQTLQPRHRPRDRPSVFRCCCSEAGKSTVFPHQNCTPHYSSSCVSAICCPQISPGQDFTDFRSRKGREVICISCSPRALFLLHHYLHLPTREEGARGAEQAPRRPTSRRDRPANC